MAAAMKMNITVGLNDRVSRGLRGIDTLAARSKRSIESALGGGVSAAAGSVAGIDRITASFRRATDGAKDFLRTSGSAGKGGLSAGSFSSTSSAIQALSSSVAALATIGIVGIGTAMGKTSKFMATPIRSISANFRGIGNQIKGLAKNPFESYSGYAADVSSGLGRVVGGIRQIAGGWDGTNRAAARAARGLRQIISLHVRLRSLSSRSGGGVEFGAAYYENMRRRLRTQIGNLRADLGRGAGQMASGLGNVFSGLGRAGAGAFSLLVKGGAALLPVLGTVLAVLSQVAAVVLNVVVKAFQVAWGAIRAFANVVIQIFQRLLSTLRVVGQAILGVSKAAGAAALVVGGVLGMIAKKSIDAAMNMEMLGVKMLTAFGGDKIAAAKAVANAIKQAVTTPFETGEIVDAYVKLKMTGVDAGKLSGTVNMLGNMASSMGKTLDDAVEAYKDAMTGEMERLKEFGITRPMMIEFGAKEASGGGVSSKTKEDLDAIRASLDRIMRTKFGGSMERMMSTAAGAISNFKDLISSIKVEIGNLLLPSLRRWLDYGSKLVQWAKDTGQFTKLGVVIDGLANRIMMFGYDAVRTMIRVSRMPGIKLLMGSLQRLAQSFGLVFSGLTVNADPAAIIDAIITRIASAINWLTTVVFNPQTLSAAWTWFTGILGSITTFVTGAVQFLVSKAGQIGATFTWLVRWGQYLAGWIYTNLPNIINTIAALVARVGVDIVAVTQVLHNMGNGLRLAFLTVGLVVWNVVQIVGAALAGLTYIILKFLDVITLSLIPGLGEAADAVGKDFTNIMKSIGSEWKNLGGQFSKGLETNVKFEATRKILDKLPDKVRPTAEGIRAFGAENPYSPARPGPMKIVPPSTMPVVPTMAPYRAPNSGGTPAPNVNFNTTIKVDGTNADPKQIAAEVDRQFEKRFMSAYRLAAAKS